jgi:hypothetical protein
MSRYFLIIYKDREGKEIKLPTYFDDSGDPIGYCSELVKQKIAISYKIYKLIVGEEIALDRKTA